MSGPIIKLPKFIWIFEIFVGQVMSGSVAYLAVLWRSQNYERSIRSESCLPSRQRCLLGLLPISLWHSCHLVAMTEAISYLDPPFLRKVLSAAFVGSFIWFHQDVTQCLQKWSFLDLVGSVEVQTAHYQLHHWLSWELASECPNTCPIKRWVNQ